MCMDDPNEIIKQLFLAVSLFEKEKNAGHAPRAVTRATYIVEHLFSLDAWLADGGFLPECWDCARPRDEEDDE